MLQCSRLSPQKLCVAAVVIIIWKGDRRNNEYYSENSLTVTNSEIDSAVDKCSLTIKVRMFSNSFPLFLGGVCCPHTTARD